MVDGGLGAMLYVTLTIPGTSLRISPATCLHRTDGSPSYLLYFSQYPPVFGLPRNSIRPSSLSFRIQRSKVLAGTFSSVESCGTRRPGWFWINAHRRSTPSLTPSFTPSLTPSRSGKGIAGIFSIRKMGSNLDLCAACGGVMSCELRVVGWRWAPVVGYGLRVQGSNRFDG